MQIEFNALGRGKRRRLEDCVHGARRATIREREGEAASLQVRIHLLQKNVSMTRPHCLYWPISLIHAA